MTIVVGVDGSVESWAALAWGQDAAAARGTDLLVLIAADDLDEADHGRPTTAEHVAGRVAGISPAAAVRIEPGVAADVLLAAAAQADLLVVGNRGLGRLRAFLADSVSDDLIGHTPTPVVLVREGPSAEKFNRVLVGVDEKAGPQVLPVAFAEAAARGAELRVLSTWEAQILNTFGAAAVSNEALTTQVEGELEAMLIPFQDRFPDVVVSTVVEFGDPVASLTHEAGSADLVVVGSGPGGLAGLLSGSKAQSLLHELSVPVAVVTTHHR